MFDLEGAITAWKHRLAAGGSCTGESLAELESHLRDSHAALAAKGLNAEESFLLAARRLGDPTALQVEYAKVHPVWRDRLLWILVGALSFQCLVVLVDVILGVSVLSAIAAGTRGTAMILLASAIAATVLGTAAGMTFALRGRSSKGIASRPVLCTVAAVAFIIVGTVLGQFTFSAALRFVDRPDFNSIVTLNFIATFASTFLIPLAAGIAIARLRRTATQPT
jgi:hypothetical protein